jgi:putative ABC transport system ATP-binding protein
MMVKLVINKKTYGDLIIFENTSIEIEKGAFVGIKGLSGSGKTTLINMIGFLEPFSGDYYIRGEVLNKKQYETFRRKYVTYVFQTSKLIPYETVINNIIMPLKNLKEPINYEEIYESAHSLGIYEILEKKAGLLSGGEQQRVAILRALATKRPIILADEPTGSLDFENKSIVMKLLSKINKDFNRTIIMVTHDNQLDSYFTHTFTIKEKVIV